MKRSLAVISILFLMMAAALADSGVLIPRDKSAPDAKVLSLDDMAISITIDNGVARVHIRQIFANHTGRIEEGNYVFALPSRATVSDFAVWDGPTRIPAVILERKRAGEIYEELKAQAIDPGLLQMGERGTEEARRSPVFSAKIVPIQPWGTKRLELEYHQTIPVENMESFMVIPLHPDAYQAQRAGHLHISLELRSAQAFSDVQISGEAYPMKASGDGHTAKATFDGQNVSLTQDLSIHYKLDAKDADTLSVITYRDPETHLPSPTESAPVVNKNEPGFFEAQAVLGTGRAATDGQSGPRTIVVLFDNSLSMQWDKLERSYAAMEHVLRALRPSDRFNLLLFNQKIAQFQAAPVSASRENVDKAVEFVRASKLRGGTDLQQALSAGIEQFANVAGENYVVLLSDGGATRGTVHNGKLGKWYAEQWNRLPQMNRPRTYVFGVGDDANLPLLRTIARQEGTLENVLSTEPVDFKLNSFISKIGRKPVAQLSLATSPESAVRMVYPLQDSTFGGSLASWVGQYTQPNAELALTMRGVRDGSPVELKQTVVLPQKSLEHAELPRLWAQARVDALLEKINREGEDQKTIDEIIQLSRRYKFVTPYTSFLAVPRALLRPRVIRPGDPILRVHTDEAIRSVIAIFPFGLTKRLRYLDGEKVWQTRFLAPEDMQDGTYSVRLIMRDKGGNTYREAKTFVIASKPPVVNIRLDSKRFHRGDNIRLKVAASTSTRTLSARIEGGLPVSLYWNQKAGANIGELEVPRDLPAGSYRLTVIAEDIAHNIGTQEVQIEVLP